MKKILLILFIIIAPFALFIFAHLFLALLVGGFLGLDYVMHKDDVITHSGMKYYNNHEVIGAFELTLKWIPKEEIFWDTYEYQNADFWFENKYYFNEVCFLYVEYDDVTYGDAKAFVLDEATLCSTHAYSYNNSQFYENLDLSIFSNNLENGDNNDLSWVNFLGYNDSNNTLFFIGFYIYDNKNMYGNEIKTQEIFSYDLERYLNKFLVHF